MDVSTGSIIISTPLLHATNFEQSVILITEKNVDGAIGFVLNKVFPKKFNELEAYKSSLPFALYHGGPVETESLFFIHNCPHLINGGTSIANNLFMGGNFNEAVQHINTKNISSSNIQLFIGYSGWNAGELEAEIEEGSWLVYNEQATQNLFNSQLDWTNMYVDYI